MNVLTNEQLQEKKANLEVELRRLQMELVDVLNSNDSLTSQNREKDAIISRKEQQLQELKDKNSHDLEQLRLEQLSLEEQYDHKAEIALDSLKRIELVRQRQKMLEEENEEVKKSIDIFKEKTTQDGAEHAVAMHKMNCDMKSLREQMEVTFKRELAEMYAMFQNQAFNEMDVAKKKAILANSKLKDELALQSVGISNLTVRCNRDKYYVRETRQEMQKIFVKIEAMRDKLSQLQLRKMNQAMDINMLQARIEELTALEKKLMEDVELWPSDTILADTENTLQVNVMIEQLVMEKWLARKQAYEKFYDDAKPIHKSIREYADANLTGKSSTGDYSVASNLSIAEEIKRDKGLSEAFYPILGKESKLLSSTSGFANMMKQLLLIWRQTAQEYDRQIMDRASQHMQSTDSPNITDGRIVERQSFMSSNNTLSTNSSIAAHVKETLDLIRKLRKNIHLVKPVTPMDTHAIRNSYTLNFEEEEAYLRRSKSSFMADAFDLPSSRNRCMSNASGVMSAPGSGRLWTPEEERYLTDAEKEDIWDSIVDMTASTVDTPLNWIKSHPPPSFFHKDINETTLAVQSTKALTMREWQKKDKGKIIVSDIAPPVVFRSKLQFSESAPQLSNIKHKQVPSFGISKDPLCSPKVLRLSHTKRKSKIIRKASDATLGTTVSTASNQSIEELLAKMQEMNG